MWVRSQDEKTLLDVNSFNIERNYGGKSKMAIVGISGTLNFFHSNAKVLGLYKTDKEAMLELKNIEDHLTEGSNAVYQVK